MSRTPSSCTWCSWNAEPPKDLLDRIAAAESAAAAKGSRGTVQAAGHALFLHTPDGFGTSELAQARVPDHQPARETEETGSGGHREELDGRHQAAVPDREDTG